MSKKTFDEGSYELYFTCTPEFWNKLHKANINDRKFISEELVREAIKKCIIDDGHSGIEIFRIKPEDLLKELGL